MAHKGIPQCCMIRGFFFWLQWWAGLLSDSSEASTFFVISHGERGKTQLFPNAAFGFRWEGHLLTNACFCHYVSGCFYTLEISIASNRSYSYRSVNGLKRSAFRSK